jgi:hypothetical protein
VTLTKRSIIVVVLALGCVSVGLAIYDWYYKRYLWPAHIQRSVAGVELTSGATLINYDGYSAYGQGAHRWRYDAAENAPLRRICAPSPIDSCRFIRTRRLNSDVEQTVSYEKGVLIVEEVWS